MSSKLWLAASLMAAAAASGIEEAVPMLMKTAKRARRGGPKNQQREIQRRLRQAERAAQKKCG